MSADQQRLNAAIQQIAERAPGVRALLEANDNKGGKPGSVGVGVSEAEETRICCDGSTSENANPGSTETDPDGAGQEGGLNSDDPALLENGSGTLSGVTDCATGEPICFSGSGFIPPDGWDDPNAPPVEESYDEDLYWRVLINDAETFTNSCITAWTTYANAAESLCDITIYDPSERCADPIDTSTAFSCDGASGFINRRSCSSTFNEACNDSPPTEEAWPEDGCTNLAIVNGSIVGSKYDPENDGSYSAPVQELEVCDAVTGDPILIRVDTNSTYKSIKSLEGDIDPDTQAGYLYDTATGQRIRQISPSEFRDPTV